MRLNERKYEHDYKQLLKHINVSLYTTKLLLLLLCNILYSTYIRCANQGCKSKLYLCSRCLHSLVTQAPNTSQLKRGLVTVCRFLFRNRLQCQFHLQVLLEYYFSVVAVSSFNNLQSNSKVTNWFANNMNKCPLLATKTQLPSYKAWGHSNLDFTLNRSGAR